ncbi:hypothetical protein LBMAG56_37710 [Verrucomicrobiota bacterium]|nr:hypothetical protein LBMAG56_37710 [Verrucomicrobiota bacterium]
MRTRGRAARVPAAGGPPASSFGLRRFFTDGSKVVIVMPQGGRAERETARQKRYDLWRRPIPSWIGIVVHLPLPNIGSSAQTPSCLDLINLLCQQLAGQPTPFASATAQPTLENLVLAAHLRPRSGRGTSCTNFRATIGWRVVTRGRSRRCGDRLSGGQGRAVFRCPRESAAAHPFVA